MAFICSLASVTFFFVYNRKQKGFFWKKGKENDDGDDDFMMLVMEMAMAMVKSRKPTECSKRPCMANRVHPSYKPYSTGNASRMIFRSRTTHR